MAKKNILKKKKPETAVSVDEANEKDVLTEKETEKTLDIVTDVYIQYADKEISTRDVLDRIKDIWTKEMDNQDSDLKKLKVYIKPEDDAAYFVINEDITGSFGL